MRADEEELRRLYQEAHMTEHAAGCLEEEQIVRAARGELSRAERGRVIDHLSGCTRCAEEYRLLALLRPWADRAAPMLAVDPPPQRAVASRRPWLAYASVAAAVVVSFLLGMRSGFRDDAGEGALHMNVPIVDIEPADAFRGSAERPRSVELAQSTTLVTFVLTPARPLPPGTYGIELRDDRNQVVWQGSGLQASEENTCTFAVPRRLLPPGESRIRLFLEDAAHSEPLEEWVVTLSYR